MSKTHLEEIYDTVIHTDKASVVEIIGNVHTLDELIIVLAGMPESEFKMGFHTDLRPYIDVPDYGRVDLVLDYDGTRLVIDQII